MEQTPLGGESSERERRAEEKRMFLERCASSLGNEKEWEEFLISCDTIGSREKVCDYIRAKIILYEGREDGLAEEEKVILARLQSGLAALNSIEGGKEE